MKRKLTFVLVLFAFLFGKTTMVGQESTLLVNDAYRGGFAIYPLPNKTLLGYRSNISGKWVFDSKYGYTFSAAPQFNLEFNLIKRKYKNELLNFYNGFGLTLDGFTPGIIVPLGIELKPFAKYPNIVLIAEASPKLTFSFSSAIYSSLHGNIGIIYFRPSKKKGQ